MHDYFLWMNHLKLVMFFSSCGELRNYDHHLAKNPNSNAHLLFGEKCCKDLVI